MAFKLRTGAYVIGSFVVDQETDILVAKFLRGTDSSPTADFAQWRNAADSSTLAKIDVAGKVFGTGLDAGSAKLTNLANATVATDAVAYGQLPSPSATLPSMDGVASAGSGIGFVRPDHVHPTDSSLFSGQIESYGQSGFDGQGGTPFMGGIPSRIAASMHADNKDVSIAGALASWHEVGGAGDGGWAHVYRWTESILSQQAPNQQAPYEPVRDLAMVMYDYNDLGWLGPSVANQTPFTNAMEAIISRLRAAAIFEESHASVSRTGTWTTGVTTGTDPTKYGSGTTYAQTTSAAATFTVAVPSDFPGGTVVLSFVSGPAGEGALWNYNRDSGAATGTIESRSVNPVSYSGATRLNGRGVVVKRFTSLAAGAHSIVVSINTLGTTATFDSWWIEATVPPLICVPFMWAPKNYDYSWVTGVGYPYGFTDTDRTNIHSRTQTVVNTFDSYVFTTDLDTAIAGDATCYAPSDPIHGNYKGHGLAANQIALAILAKQRTLANHTRGNVVGGFTHLTPNTSDRNILQPSVEGVTPLTLRQNNRNTQTAYLERIENKSGTLLGGWGPLGTNRSTGFEVQALATGYTSGLKVSNISGVQASVSEFGAPADANPKFAILNGGLITWGVGGATGVDTTLTRTAAGKLKLSGATNGAFVLDDGGGHTVTLGYVLGLPAISFDADIAVYRNAADSLTVAANAGAIFTGSILTQTGPITNRSGAAGTKAIIDLGRTAKEHELTVASATNDIFTGTAAGDLLIGMVSTSAHFRVGFAGGGGSIIDANLFGVSVAGALGATGAISGTDISATGNLTYTGNLLGPTSGQGTVFTAQGLALAAPASAASGAANICFFVPIVVTQRAVLSGIRYKVGATASGNVQVSLYSNTGTTRHAISASVAQAAATTIQSVNFTTPTSYTAVPGLYWLLIQFSSATATFLGLTSGNWQGRSSTTTPGAFTLPATITTPADTAQTTTTTIPMATY